MFQSKYVAENVLLDLMLAERGEFGDNHYLALERVIDARHDELCGRFGVRVLLAVSERVHLGQLSEYCRPRECSFSMHLGTQILRWNRTLIEPTDILEILANIRESERWGKFYSELQPFIIKFAKAANLSQEWASAIDDLATNSGSDLLSRQIQVDVAAWRHRVQRHGYIAELPRFIDRWQDPFHNTAFHDLNIHANTLKKTQPSKAWLAAAKEIVESIDKQALTDAFKQAIFELRCTTEKASPAVSNHMRGLCWMITVLPEPVRILGDMLCACGAQSETSAERAPVGFSACLNILNGLDRTAAIAEIVRVYYFLRDTSSFHKIDKVLREIALKRGIEFSQVEELLVPDHGLDCNGERLLTSAIFSARIAIEDSLAVSARWWCNGKEFKASKKNMTGSSAGIYRDVLNVRSHVEKDLAAHCLRLMHAMIVKRSWSVEGWNELFRKNGLLRNLAERLVWIVRQNGTNVAFISKGEERYVRNPKGLISFPEDATILLWHPAEADSEEKEWWQEFIVCNGIRQPFSQVFRERIPFHGDKALLLEFPRDYSFANKVDYSEVGERERYHVLMRILPLLPFARALSLDRHVLRVRGKFDRYEIKLRTGEATCGVDHFPLSFDHRELEVGDRYYTPHCGDSLLEAILEKARILSADDKIRDARLLEFIVKPDA